MNVDNVGTTDSEPFRQQKIPAITVHSVTQETLKILHSKADTIEAVHLDEYYRTYRLLAAYLAVLDQKLGVASARLLKGVYLAASWTATHRHRAPVPDRAGPKLHADGRENHAEALKRFAEKLLAGRNRLPHEGCKMPCPRVARCACTRRGHGARRVLVQPRRLLLESGLPK